MIGTLVINERILNVVGVRLADGEVVFVTDPAPWEGPDLEHNQVWRLHAPDGSLVAVARVPFHWKGPSMSEVNTVCVEFPLSIEGSNPGEPWPVATERKQKRRRK